jgi:glycosyltransferase involved in cell wall biosynthesis
MSEPQTPAEKPRLLWANHACLLDTTSGAAMSARQMLLCLQARGYEIQILGTTQFDAPQGVAGLGSAWAEVKKNRGKTVKLVDGPLQHQLLVTGGTQRKDTTFHEMAQWHHLYTSALDTFQPDIVWYFGGHPIDFLIPDEARSRNIATAAYLVNGNYHGTRWCRDVDLIITDTQATADLYSERSGLTCTAVGTFIPPEQFVAKSHSRERVLFINPSPEKGAFLVAALAMALEKSRPDIQFEVVESRGNWSQIIQMLTAQHPEPRSQLSNVIVTPSTRDMRPVYGRARLLLTPSLWYESGARVVGEALLNGIPVIATDNGGLPDLLGGSGHLLRLPSSLHQAPYNKLPDQNTLNRICDLIARHFDDSAWYTTLCEQAHIAGRQRHSMDASTQRLSMALNQLIASPTA